MRVSIIIPTRNRKTLLRKCLQRLAIQVGKDDEVLVIDNGSRDNTKRVVLDFQDKLPLRYFFEPRKGPSFARNLGVKKAKGEIVAFLDDDCLASANWLSEIKKASQQKRKQNMRCVYQGKISHHFLKGSLLSKIFFLRYREDWWQIKRSFGLRKGYYIDFLNSGNIFLKKQILDKLDYVFDTKLFPFIGEEKDLAFRLQLAGCRIVYASQVKVRHLKQKTTFSRFLSFAFGYGRRDGILETKYPFSKTAKLLFREKVELILSKKREKKQLFFPNLKSILETKGKLSYKISAQSLVALWNLSYFLGKAYGMIYYKIISCLSFFLKRMKFDRATL